MIHKLETPDLAAPLFKDWAEGMIWACLQGRMGAVLANDTLSSAAAVLGDFAFFAGTPDTALLDAVSVPLLVPQTDAWADAMASQLGQSAQPITRYATRKDTVFDRETLRTYAHSLSKSYTIRIINQKLYELCWKNSWSRDLVSQYPTWAAYRDLGLGVAVLRDGALAAGASSYASFDGGMEIEIDTKPEERRRGLARACGAALILECLERGLYPSWDAHDTVSLALAEQLGYRADKPYLTCLRCSPEGRPGI